MTSAEPEHVESGHIEPGHIEPGHVEPEHVEPGQAEPVRAGPLLGEPGPGKGRVTLHKIFWTFFKVGLFTFGGGLAMTTVLRHELVLRRKWIPDDDFMAELSTATLVPGPIAVNMAYLQGRRLRGGMGSAVAVFGTILPSFWTILLVAWFAFPYFTHPKVAAFLHGCAVAVAGQLAFTSLIFCRRHLRSWRTGVACAVGLFVVAGLGAHPVWAVLIAGGIGYFLSDAGPPKNQEKLTEPEV